MEERIWTEVGIMNLAYYRHAVVCVCLYHKMVGISGLNLSPAERTRAALWVVSYLSVGAMHVISVTVCSFVQHATCSLLTTDMLVSKELSSK